MAPPLTVGLTGAVASGKSAALEIFGRLGAATISADAVVHELLDSEPMLSRLVERWGAEVVEGGRADRNRIGQIVFADPAELGWLESNIHPLVGDSVATWLAGLDSNCRIAVAEIPLLFEGEMHSVFDTTVTVVSNEAQVEQVCRDAEAWVRRGIGRDDVPFEVISALTRNVQMMMVKAGGGDDLDPS